MLRCFHFRKTNFNFFFHQKVASSLKIIDVKNNIENRYIQKRHNSMKYVNRSPQLFEWSKQITNGELTLQDLEKTSEYQIVVDSICDTIRHSNKNILNLLKSIVIMGVDPNSKIVQFLENELLFKINFYDLPLLMNTYELYSMMQDSSPLRKQIVGNIFNKITDLLERKDATFSDIIYLIKMSRNFPTNILIQIDQQASRYLEQHDDITLDSLCYLLVLLSRFKRRNKPLIRNVVSKLLQFKMDEVQMIPPHLINMLSALSRLNYYEVNLIEKSVEILIKFDFLASCSDGSKRDFIIAISQFNFYSQKLIDYYIQNLIEKPELFKHQDLIGLVITLARLNCQQPDVLETIKSHIPVYHDQDIFTSEMQNFNYVYSLTYLNIADKEQIKLFLSIEAFKKLEAETSFNFEEDLSENKLSLNENNKVVDSNCSFQTLNLRRKWLCFVGLCKIRSEMYDSFFDSESQKEQFEQFFNNLEFQTMKKSKDSEAFRENIQKLLENIAPKDKYFVFDLKTPYGFSIDAKLLVNSEGKPQLLTDSNETFKKIALMCIGFNDTILDSSSELIGGKEAEFKILRSLGYIVVPIHQNILQSSTTLAKVRFLQNLIESHLKE